MSKVEVEYTRTRKRKYIQKQYADILERLGLVKRVLPEARPQQKVQSRRTISGSGDLRSGPATAGIPVADALQDAKVELQVQRPFACA